MEGKYMENTITISRDEYKELIERAVTAECKVGFYELERKIEELEKKYIDTLYENHKLKEQLGEKDGVE